MKTKTDLENMANNYIALPEGTMDAIDGIVDSFMQEVEDFTRKMKDYAEQMQELKGGEDNDKTD